MAVLLSGLSDLEKLTIQRLLAQLNARATRNIVRRRAYDGKDRVEMFSKILPDHYSRLSLVLGWSAKAVDLLALRCNLEGFVWADGDLDSLGYRQLWDGNALGAEVHQGLTSSLIHSASFATWTRGTAGEPPVVVQFWDALTATGDWNSRRRGLDSLLVVTDWDTQGAPVEVALYLPGQVITAGKSAKGWVEIDRQIHAGGILAEALPYSSTLGRPFGRSRITRPMLGLQAAGVRALARLEGHMDIYSYPEFWILGSDPSILTGKEGLVQTSWHSMMGRIKGIPDDPGAPDPQTARADVKQFAAASPEPHLAAINAYSKLFAREASLPDSSLAVTDFANPTSADAYDASQHDLIASAEGATGGWSRFLRRIMAGALALANDLPAPPAEWLSIQDRWRDPRYTSRASAADAGVKQLAGAPWLAETRVGLGLLGLSPQQVELALSERRRANASSALERLTGGGDDVSR